MLKATLKLTRLQWRSTHNVVSFYQSESHNTVSHTTSNQSPGLLGFFMAKKTAPRQSCASARARASPCFRSRFASSSSLNFKTSSIFRSYAFARRFFARPISARATMLTHCPMITHQHQHIWTLYLSDFALKHLGCFALISLSLVHLHWFCFYWSWVEMTCL